jgi:hypothetical protein
VERRRRLRPPFPADIGVRTHDPRRKGLLLHPPDGSCVAHYAEPPFKAGFWRMREVGEMGRVALVSHRERRSIRQLWKLRLR